MQLWAAIDSYAVSFCMHLGYQDDEIAGKIDALLNNLEAAGDGE